DHRHGAVDPLARQGVGRPDQGAVRALPQGAREARSEDRRHPEAARLHLERSTTMTSVLEHMEVEAPATATIQKVAIVISKGSLEGIYPGLILANGARMEGIDADIFFTFF